LAISAASSALTFGVGGIFGHEIGSFGTELARAGMHGLVGGGLNAAQGGNFWQGFGTGFASSLAGSGMMAAGMPSDMLPYATGLVGAGSSWALGGDPISGFWQGYGIGALNHTGGSGTEADPFTLDEVVVTGTAPFPMQIERGGMLYRWNGFDYVLIGERGLQNVYPEFDVLMVGRGLMNMFGNLAKGGSKVAVQFGKSSNQVSHAFRHTDALGLDRSLVQSTVQNHFSTVSSQVVTGQPFNQIVQIGGHRIQYTAWKLADGTFNIGRMHAIP